MWIPHFLHAAFSSFLTSGAALLQEFPTVYTTCMQGLDNEATAHGNL